MGGRSALARIAVNRQVDRCTGMDIALCPSGNLQVRCNRCECTPVLKKNSRRTEGTRERKRVRESHSGGSTGAC